MTQVGKVQIDNRGTAAVPYGFVMVGEDVRFGFAPNVHVTDPVPGAPGNMFFHIQGNWRTPTILETKAAIDALRDFLRVNRGPTTKP